FEETLLYIENLSVAYGDHVIIKDINITEKNVVRSSHESTGQIIAVVGRSGRGKSTFFKALTGLVTPHSGKILIRDFSKEDVNAAKQVKEGDIGFVDQKYTLFRHKTVQQTFQFALRKSNLSKDKIAEKIKEYAERWGLDACLEKYPNELSGGQRQRVAIIEQLFSSEKYIVLDEPFSGLDIGNIEEVKKTFDMLSDECEQNTILFSTHDLKLAIDIAQVIYVIGNPTIDGVKQNYGTVVATFDLREKGVAWKDYCEDHEHLYKEVVEIMMNS
ncbi:MAG: ABC transporter ATP-binding protein, partial [Chryseobacterium sp.]|nr:ABC transporter ATP-binding protein [Candidatus Chryseobacterium enterohippi]